MTETLRYRDSTISIMKGLAIIGVVIGHASEGGIAEIVVNQYHLATFFFVAGMCFKDKYLADLKKYAWRRFKSLYIPFMQFGLFYLILHNLFVEIGIESNSYDISAALHEIRNFTIGLTSEDPLMGAMWFCPSLMVVSILSACVLKVVNERMVVAIVKFAILCLIPLFGELLCDFHVKSPRCLWEYMQICGVFFAGYYFVKLKVSKYLIGYKRIALPFFAGLLVVILCLLGFRGNLQSSELSQNDFISTTIIAVLSSICVYCISTWLATTENISKILACIGEHSFSIMALHFLAFKIVGEIYILFVDRTVLLYTFPTIKTNSFLWILLYIMIGIILPLLVSKMYFYSKQYLTFKVINNKIK